jgi:hypothetical protein
LVQALEAILVNGREVDEYIVSTFIRGDKSKTFITKRIVEEVRNSMSARLISYKK